LRANIFPSVFPSELSAAAFITNDEVAWPATRAAEAVDWLGAHEHAVLGTELWLLKDAGIQSLPVGSAGMREIHGSTVNRKDDEIWNSYVVRAAAETSVYLRSFNPSDMVETGRLYFNIAWIGEIEFNRLAR
jgi:hypothetical protein